MGQLPEVEVTRKELERDAVGKRVKDVTVKTASLVSRHRNRPDFIKAVTGHRIASVDRRGIHLMLAMDGEQTLVVRLGEHGSLSRETAQAESGKHTQLVLTFTTGGALHYIDAGKDGAFFVVPTPDIGKLPVLSKTGIDPLADTFTWRAFGEELVRRGGLLKPLLLDSSFVVGLGDRYSDEILWTAGLSAGRPTASLSSQEVRRLYRALLEVVGEAVKQRTADGVPQSDGTELEEDEGEFWLRVWGREGLPCARCRTPVRHGEVVEGFPSYHCANCQT